MFYDKKFIIVSGLLMSAAISATNPDLEKWFRTQEKKVNKRANLVERLANKLTKIEQHEILQWQRQKLEETYPAPILRDAKNLNKRGPRRALVYVVIYSLMEKEQRWKKYLKREGLTPAQRARIKTELISIDNQIDESAKCKSHFSKNRE